jgi:hypothetical protein
MSLLESLPVELQTMIYEHKFHLETNSLQAFVDDFEMKVLYTKTVYIRDFIKYKRTIHLMYKPTQKCMIVHYSHCESEKSISRFSKKDVIHSLAGDVSFWEQGDGWCEVRDEFGVWYKDYSYENYCKTFDNMSFKKFVYWRNEVKKLQLMLKDRYDKFVECYDDE